MLLIMLIVRMHFCSALGSIRSIESLDSFGNVSIPCPSRLELPHDISNRQDGIFHLSDRRCDDRQLVLFRCILPDENGQHTPVDIENRVHGRTWDVDDHICGPELLVGLGKSENGIIDSFDASKMSFGHSTHIPVRQDRFDDIDEFLESLIASCFIKGRDSYIGLKSMAVTRQSLANSCPCPSFYSSKILPLRS